jgi:hypothetical protein
MKFQSMEELDLFLDSLRDRAPTTTGNWTLAQILCHIGDSMEFFLTQKEGAFTIPSFLQDTVGKLLLQKFYLFGSMDRGLPNPIKKGEPKNGDPQEELHRILTLTKRFKESSGPFNSHPVFGALTKEEIIKLHLLHSSHHFSFIHIG